MVLLCKRNILERRTNLPEDSRLKARDSLLVDQLQAHHDVEVINFLERYVKVSIYAHVL